MIIFLLGILGGVALSLFFSFGPAFFSQIQASIHYGFRNAVPFAYGISTSDVLIVAILLLISNHIPPENLIETFNNRWIIYVGAAVVASFGFYTMFLKTRRATESKDTDRINFHNVQIPSRLSVYFRGVVLNFFNPVIWIYWATIVTIFICGEDGFSLGERYLFFGGVLCATLSLDILKCKLASLLQRIITFRFLKIFNKTVGLILIGFAIFMVISTSGYYNSNQNQKSKEMIEGITHMRHNTRK